MTNQTQTTLEEVMPAKNKWDWFGGSPEEIYHHKTNQVAIITKNGRVFRLPDLLANKSWCIAVWGEQFYNQEANKSYKILREKGNQAALNYIKQTKL